MAARIVEMKMLDAITEKLSQAVKSIKGQSRLTEDNVASALRAVRLALLDADVALPVVRGFVDGLREDALGEKVLGSLTPSQAFVGLAHARLRDLMGGGGAEDLNFAVPAPAVAMFCGLQGAGKTTTSAKLAKKLKDQRQRVLLASCDTQRPAAMRQLEVLAESIGVDFYAEHEGKSPEQIAADALRKAKIGAYDILIMDTAGRVSIDEALMDELARVESILKPAECLLAIDAMMGQQALSVAQAFSAKVKLTGLALTKLDGDSRGGAMLSAQSVTGLPIKLAGVSEKVDGLEEFDPERMANRILGMGDIVGLVEQARAHHDEKAAEKLAAKIKAGAKFDLDDFHAQLVQMRAMGGVAGMMDKLPEDARKMAAQAGEAGSDKQLGRMQGMISSMTPAERAKPELLKGSRKLRVAKGAGVEVMHVNQMLKQYEAIASIMKGFQGGALGKLLGMANGGARAAGKAKRKGKNKSRR